MFRLFKKKPKQPTPPSLMDLEGQPLKEGDWVLSHRYDLGKCQLTLEGMEYFYQSETSETRISYTKMIDAITGHQKVTKCLE